MGLVNSALQIGRSALQTYQSTLQVIGNNVANASNPDYTRQTVGLSSVQGTPTAEGFQPGAGVAMNELKRNLDEGLENRLRAAIGDYESAGALQQSFGQIEPLFDETDGQGVSVKLNEFFNSLSDVQNNPSDLAVREVALAAGAELATSLNQLRSQLGDVGADLDQNIEDLVVEADDLAAQIAELNREVAAAEAGTTSTAHALRDQRDALLRDLSELFDVSSQIQPDGAIYVYIGSEPLVMGGSSRGLTTAVDVDGSYSRTTIRFADTGATAAVHGGKIEGLIAARDGHAYGRIDSVDELAAAVIFEVNKIHSEGQGLTGFTSVTGTYAASDTTAALNSADADLPFAAQNGSFFVAVTDNASGTTVAYRVEVDLDGLGTDTSLDSLVADINASVVGMTAAVTPDGRLQLNADTGFTFAFGHDGATFREDTSNALATLGVNTFFDGRAAADMAVNETLRGSPSLLAAASTGLEGDGTNAGRLAQAGVSTSDLLGGKTLIDGYNSIATDVAVAGNAVQDDIEVTEAVLAALQAQKESVSGVNLDEEAVELLKFERAYQGAARYVTTVNTMLAELISLIR